ncbi:MAG: hypothetical protein QOF58_2984 [Pseudonocardiales bacterium]|jgi:hypothetical protein|nr:hypothetical protein [Pseudonocardiales bacterium]
MGPMTNIRFSQRAQQLWDSAGVGLRPDQIVDYNALLEQVRAANMVIDYTDRVIKPTSPIVGPERSATLDEIEGAFVV